jgi:replicative DNA helicase
MTRSTDSSGPPDEGRTPPPTEGAFVAPHSQEAEEAVLGTMLLSEKAIADCVLLVSPEDFYRPANKAIYEAILTVYDRGQGGEVDPLTVNDALEGSSALDGVGGAGYLVSLQSKAPVIGHATRYAAIVREHAVRRRMIAAGHELIQGGREASNVAADALAEVGNTVNELTLSMTGERRYTTSEYVAHNLDDLVDKWGGHSQKGTLTNFKQIDDLTDGLHRGRFYILGARPGQGKSVMAVNIATEFALNRGKTVLLFSLEMSEKEIAYRSMLSRCLLHKGDLENGWLSHSDWLGIRDAEGDYRDSNLIIDATPAITIQAVEARCRQEKARTGNLDLIIIDYLGLMGTTGSSENRQLEVQSLSKRLKALSRTMDVPLLALSQLSRKVEDRNPPRPQLSDLRESGSLEQDADCVLFIYRESEYVPNSEWEGFAEVIVAKNRQGPQGVARLAWLPEMSMFGNVSTAM